ncbi:MAG: hypothetical protein ACYTF3_01370 [Planctomycetota bacterium]
MVDQLPADYLEIPEEVRERVDREVELQVFDVLHAEAVKRKDLAAPPRTIFDKMPGRVALLLMQVAIGVVFGSWSVIAVVYAIRSLVTVI